MSAQQAAAPHWRSDRRWVWAGWLAAHLIPVIWISIAATSTGDVQYYFRGMTGRDATAMDEYPEVGTWPTRLVSLLTDDEGAFVAGFIALSLIVSAVFTYCLLRWDRDPGHRAAWFWVAFAAVSGPIFLTRLDIFPGMLVAATAALLLSDSPARSRWAPVLLAVATMMKLWPGVLAAGLVGGWRRAGTWARIAWFVGGLVVLALIVLAIGGTDRLTSPLTYQTDRGLQVESILATPLLLAYAITGDTERWHVQLAASKSWEISGTGAQTLQTVSTVGTALVVLAALAWAVARLLRDDWTPLRSLAFFLAAVMGIIVTNKVFSPQYLVWLAPAVAVALIVSRRRIVSTIAWQTVLAAFCTLLVYPGTYGLAVDNPSNLGGALVFTVRNLVVLVLAVSCLRWCVTAGRTADHLDDAAARAGSGRSDVEDQGDRTVVDQVDRHVRAEPAGGDDGAR